MELYDHQRQIISQDPKQYLVAFGTGGGKTRICLELAGGRILIIAPKQQRVDETWERNARLFGINKDITIVSKEEFRRDFRLLGQYDTVIVDECHYMLGMLPDTKQVKLKQVPKTSQMFDALVWYIKEHKPERLYLASATPASRPMNVFAISKVFGRNWDFYKFRDRFYIQRKMGFRNIFIPKTDKNSKELLAKLIKSFGCTGDLNSFFDVPEQTHKTIYVELTKGQKDAIKKIRTEEADPMVSRARQRTIENGILYGLQSIKVSDREDRLEKSTSYFDDSKLEHLLNLAAEFPKLLIFCAFTGQIELYKREIEKEGFRVSTLTGSTKDRATVIQEAEASDRRVVIAQASISSGYELPSFPCVVFASKSYKYVDYEQAKGRVLRANHLKKNLYVHLVVKGGVDEDCHKAIISGQDFHEKVMEQ